MSGTNHSLFVAFTPFYLWYFIGIEGLRALCIERAIVVDKTPFLRTSIPPVIDYPIDMAKGFPFTESLVQLFYNEDIVGKIKGLFGLVKNG